MEQLDLFCTPDKPKAPDTFTARPTTRIADLPPAPPPVTIKAHPPTMKANSTNAQRTAKPREYAPTTRNPHEAAHTLAEAVSAAWHGARGGEDITIPLGIVAGIALWPLKGPQAPLLADWWRSLEESQIHAALLECWNYWWIMRPDLVDRAVPINSWLQEENRRPNRGQAIRAVVDAAVTHGLLHLTGSMDPSSNADTDILGAVLTCMRSTGGSEALAEFHTPPEVAELIARVQLDMPLEPGMSFNDPASGTGGLIRAAAQVLRDQGLDPAQFTWVMNDVDPLAAAGAAVNAILWGLGPNVVVSCADILHEADPTKRALKARQEAYERRDDLRRCAALLAATRKVDRAMADLLHPTDVQNSLLRPKVPFARSCPLPRMHIKLKQRGGGTP